MQETFPVSERVMARCQQRVHWLGSFYELGLYFAQRLLDQSTRLHLLKQVWSSPCLRGVVKGPEQYGQPWQSVNQMPVDHPYQRCYGCIQLDAKRVVGCATDFLEGEEGTWCILFIPLGMLNLVYPVDYLLPITYEGNPWTRKVDRLLASIGMQVYREVPFTLGALGEEASARPLDRQLADLACSPSLLVPDAFFRRHHVSAHGLRSPEGLWWTGGKDTAKKR